MFSELPKLFDRSFAIGFFLPAVVFVAVTYEIARRFGLAPGLGELGGENPVLNATLAGFVTWIFAILLAALNRPIIRLKEGYSELNPARLWRGLERWKFERLQASLTKVRADYRSAKERGEQPAEKVVRSRRRLSCEAVVRFPGSVDQLLPTAFGNTLRAFEMYPTEMYGIDSISGWDRLVAVVPKDYRETIDAEKAQVDFWVNVWALSWVVAFGYATLAAARQGTDFLFGREPLTWMLGAVALAWWASRRARYAAVGWGALVKAAFDLYLPALRKTLELERQPTRERERAQWTSFSQAVIYRRPDLLPERRSATDHLTGDELEETKR